MAETVSELVVAIRADITQLKADLDKARGETRKWGASNRQELRGLRREFKNLKEPISNISQLANGLGTAFGGAASKATGLVNGLVSSFVAGGPVGIAIGATTGLVSVLIDRFDEARKAAEKARQAQADEQIATAKTVRDMISKADEEIAALKAKAGRGEDPGLIAARSAAADAERTAKESVLQAEEALNRLSKERLDRDEKGRSRVSQEEIDAARERVLQAQLELERVQEGNVALNARLDLLADLRNETGSSGGSGGRGGGAGSGRGRSGRAATPLEAGPTGDPFATRESLAAYLKAGIAEQTRRDEAAAALREAAEANRKTAVEVRQLGEASSDAAVDLGGLGGVIGNALREGNAGGAFGSVAGFFGKQLLGQIPIIGPFLSELAGGLGLAKGGLVGYAGGGPVAASDTVPAMLTPGEYVLPVSAVRELGLPNLERMRRGGSSTAVNMGGINVTINGNASQGLIKQLRKELVTQGDSLSRALASVLQKQTGLRLSNT